MKRILYLLALSLVSSSAFCQSGGDGIPPAVGSRTEIAEFDFKLGILRPDPRIDYKMTVVEPDPRTDFKMIVVDPEIERRLSLRLERRLERRGPGFPYPRS